MGIKSMQGLSRVELAQYNGKDGAPAYIAYNGRVYDVSNSYHWRNGRHHALHTAGADLTDSLREAPHAAHLLDRFPVVGTLEED
jgi:predicted heme/steroid binding protein